MLEFLLIAFAIFLILFLFNDQLGVIEKRVLYKLLLVFLSPFIGYWIYRAVHSDGTRVETYLYGTNRSAPTHRAALYCRTAFVIGTMLAVALVL